MGKKTTTISNKPNQNKPLSSTILTNDIAQFGVYANGTTTAIEISELINNEVAIRQLVNEHNINSKELSDLQNKITELTSEKEYYKTSP